MLTSGYFVYPDSLYPIDLPSLKLTAKAPEKWMVGRLYTLLLGRGMAYFQGRTVSFRECRSLISWKVG